MMEFFNPAMEWWNEYYPIVIGFVTTAIGVITAVMVVYSKIKPLIDKVGELKSTVEDKANTLSPLEMINASTQVTDLKAKLENPTISDSLKLQYQQQLYSLESILEKTNSVVDNVSGKF